MNTKIIKSSPPAEATNPHGKIIEREVLLAHEEARRVLVEAEVQAAAVVESARQQAAAVLRRAEREGQERSLADWQQRLARLAEARQQVLAAARPQILRLAVRVAEKILRRRLQEDPAAFDPLVEETLETVRAQPGQQIVLRAHAEDRARLEDLRRRLIERHPGWSSLQVQVDPAMAVGGCRVETEYGTVDAGLSTQLRAIEKILLEGQG